MDAMDRVRGAERALSLAAEQHERACAEAARLAFLAYAAANPVVIGFEWSSSWEYDDENYYESLSFRHIPKPGTCDSTLDKLEDDWELYDLMSHWGRPVLARLCGNSDYEGQITVKEAEERRF